MAKEFKESRLEIRLTEELKIKLEQYCLDNNISVSKFLRQIIINAIEEK